MVSDSQSLAYPVATYLRIDERSELIFSAWLQGDDAAVLVLGASAKSLLRAFIFLSTYFDESRGSLGFLRFIHCSIIKVLQAADGGV
ncbi:hypothetical protein AcV7_002324 [Taiwanofungus camphoratus]|nr:hypothetical protein AcV7_002324 [Antrodia cinnamomea]